MDEEFRDRLERMLWAMVIKYTMVALVFGAAMMGLQIFVNLTGIVIQPRDLVIGIMSGALCGTYLGYMDSKSTGWYRLRFYLSYFAMVSVCTLVIAFNTTELTAGIQAGFIAGMVCGFLNFKIVHYQPKGA